jgi:hypothetical protein
VTRCVRVGTLDQPSRCPPLAHIFVRSKQAWLTLPADAPAFKGYYDGAKTGPASSLARWAAASEVKKAASATEARSLVKSKTAKKS